MISLIALASAAFAMSMFDHDPPTVAEASNYRKTSTSAEAIDFLRALDATSDHADLIEFGRTTEDRPIPLLIMANPSLTTVDAARASNKLIVFAFGNIHAGEVDGKEAILALAREIARCDQPEGHPWLEDIVFLLMPNYNADGNDRMSPDNRPGQIGPDEMGTRANADGLDLNRDYIKLEAVESQAMVRLLTDWDPHLVIDTHTTNGSIHRYTLTYESPTNPSGHPAPVRFLRDRLFPAVTERLRERTGYETFHYGNFNRDWSEWHTYSAQPRFGGPYHGLRGTMSILTESYSYASYKDRVLCHREFLREVFEFAATHADEIRQIHDQVRGDTIAAGAAPRPDDRIGLRHRIAAFDEPATILSYARAPDADGTLRVTEDPHAYEVTHYGRFEPTESVTRPLGYLIPPDRSDVIEKLHQHGISTALFVGTAEVEAYTVDRLRRAHRPFQGHHELQIDATIGAAHERSFSADDGWIFVTTAQPLGTLIVYLLEPESDDGLATWNILARGLEEGRPYPVLRVRRVTAEDDVDRSSSSRATD